MLRITKINNKFINKTQKIGDKKTRVGHIYESYIFMQYLHKHR